MSVCNAAAITGIELPDPRPDGVPCCDGYAYLGRAYCTCWERMHDREQQEPDTGVEATARELMCSDCAFRPRSPERTDSDRAISGSADLLAIVNDPERAFWCHDGMRRVVALRHPNGLRVEVAAQDGVTPYDPPIIDGVPYRADGRPGLHCAGLMAARRAKEWLP